MLDAAPRSLFVPRPEDPARRLHALHWPACGPARQSPLVCLHGLTRLATDFTAVGAALSATRDVYAFDMPGRGESSWLADGALYNYGTYLADTRAMLQAFGLTRFDLLGTSMGGLIGLMLAALVENSGLQRLVLNDIGPLVPLAALRRIGEHVGQNPHFADLRQAEIYCLKTYGSFGLRGDEAWRFFTRSSVRAAEDGGYRLHYDPKIAGAFAALKEDVDLWQLYDAVRVPTLLLRGETSDTLLPETAEAMGQRGPKPKLVTLPGCGHAPALVDAAQTAVIAEFLA